NCTTPPGLGLIPAVRPFLVACPLFYIVFILEFDFCELGLELQALPRSTFRFCTGVLLTSAGPGLAPTILAAPDSGNTSTSDLASALNSLRDIAAKHNSFAQVSQSSSSTAGAQRIGLLEFDTFHASDIGDWLNLVSGGTANPTLLTALTRVDVNGGVPTPGPGEAEVLLDIDAALLVDPAATTSYAVYDGP